MELICTGMELPEIVDNLYRFSGCQVYEKLQCILATWIDNKQLSNGTKAETLNKLLGPLNCNMTC